VAETFRRFDYDNVTIDGLSNVIGRIPGSGTGPALLLAGHTDTVFPRETPVASGAQWRRAGRAGDW
jgi:acetylornithine deacetylase/succinyl-diaminopimelate desuccinylase-like protein